MSNNDAAISAMVAAQANGMGIQAHENTAGSASMSVTVEHSNTGEFSAGPVHVEGSAPSAGRIPDDGSLDIGTEVARLQAGISNLRNQLDAHTFDKDTGAKIYNLPEYSGARRAVQLQLDTAIRTADYQGQRLEALKAQRASDAQAGSITADPRNLIALAAGGNPVFSKAISEALAKQDAEAAAAAIRKARDGQ